MINHTFLSIICYFLGILLFFYSLKLNYIDTYTFITLTSCIMGFFFIGFIIGDTRGE